MFLFKYLPGIIFIFKTQHEFLGQFLIITDQAQWGTRVTAKSDTFVTTFQALLTRFCARFDCAPLTTKCFATDVLTLSRALFAARRTGFTTIFVTSAVDALVCALLFARLTSLAAGRFTFVAAN